jgi:hypothetical protein
VNVKARAIERLKLLNELQNFWALMRWWKVNDGIPDDFSVVVQGPPNSERTRLVKTFRRLWPWCTAREQSDRYLTYLADWAGYDLVLKTQLCAKEIRGLNVEWQVCQIMKSRWFEIQTETVSRVNEETGQLEECEEPHMYDLTPYVDLRRAHLERLRKERERAQP